MKGRHEVKRIIAALLLFSVLLCSCGQGGNADLAVTVRVDSAVYDERDIYSAIEVACDYFERHFDGCTLTSISYAGDEKSAGFADRAEQYGGREVIVLTSSFLTGSEAGDGSLNPNDIYTGWLWILVRGVSGGWRHADHGY